MAIFVVLRSYLLTTKLSFLQKNNFGHTIEGAEECDCGMSYTTCSDPCCYAAHISPDDLSWNSTAVPCRTHRSPICINPFRFVA